jgi:DNA replication protein DnaC
MRIEKMNKVRSMDLLILDDLGLNPLTNNAVVDLLTILDDRVGRRSTIVSAQMPVDDWHEYLGGGAVADAIMDRLIQRLLPFAPGLQDIEGRRRGAGAGFGLTGTACAAI